MLVRLTTREGFPRLHGCPQADFDKGQARRTHRDPCPLFARCRPRNCDTQRSPKSSTERRANTYALSSVADIMVRSVASLKLKL